MVEQQPRLRAKIIYNPESGDKMQKAASAMQYAQRLREEHNWEVDVEATRRSRHAIELAKEAALDGVNVVFAMGGDGTANEVARGLLRSKTALAILPEGTVNIGARALKVPRDPIEAIDSYVQGNIHTIDVGAIVTREKGSTIYGNIFLFIADLGHVGRAINGIHEPGKKRKKSGVIPNIVEGVRQLPHAETPSSVINIDGENTSVQHLVQVFVQNTPDLSFISGVRPDAQFDNGQLAITIYSGKHESPKSNVLALARSLTGKLIGLRRPSPNETQRNGRRIIIASESPLYGDFDGEPLGSGVEREFFVMPDALRMLVPKSEEVDIFSRPGIPLIPSVVH